MKFVFNAMTNQFRRLLREEAGLSTVEYAVAGGLIAAAVVTAFTNLGSAVNTKLGTITTAIGG